MELRGAPTMGILDFYRDSFIQFGYPRQEVEQVISTAETEDYHALVSILHAREPEVAGAASRESAGSPTPVSPLLELLSPLHLHQPNSSSAAVVQQ